MMRRAASAMMAPEAAMTDLKTVIADLPVFDRHFWDRTFRFTRIGTGALGGKASGLAFAKDLLAETIDAFAFPDIDVNIPTMAVIATDCFDEFIARNRLGELRVEELPDDHVGHAFQPAVRWRLRDQDDPEQPV